MKDLTPHWYKPEYQPKADESVEFLLKPIDLEAQYALQMSLDEHGRPNWDGVKAASKFIAGWRGLPYEYSRQKLREIMFGTAQNLDWMLWLHQIACRAYAASILTDDETKN